MVFFRVGFFCFFGGIIYVIFKSVQKSLGQLTLPSRYSYGIIKLLIWFIILVFLKSCFLLVYLEESCVFWYLIQQKVVNMKTKFVKYIRDLVGVSCSYSLTLLFKLWQILNLPIRYFQSLFLHRLMNPNTITLFQAQILNINCQS